MNREIKFRAWDAQLGEMYTPQFPYVGAGSSARDIAIMINGTVITPSSYDLDVFSALKPPVPELVLMQFTGLKDNSENEIYESDIVDWPTPDEGTLRCEVRWYKGGFFLLPIGKDGYRYPLGDWATMCEVKGNKHQNPELLNL